MKCVKQLGFLGILMTLIATSGLTTSARADDLRATLLAAEPSGGTLQASLEYVVVPDILPPPIPPYTIAIGLDKTGDSIIDVLLYTIPGNTTLGVYSWSQDIRPDLNALAAANRIQNGDRLVAFLDNTNAVNETTGGGEGNNTAVAVPFYVDIVAESLVLDAANQATLTFLVNSPARLRNFRIEFYIDDNPQNGVWDPTDTTIFSDVVNGNPGIRTITADYTTNPPATGQMIFARVETDSQISENQEGNNRAAAANAALTDLHAVSLAYDPGAQAATLDYFVQSTADVPAFTIEFILDADNDLMPSAGDVIVGTVPGVVTPGAHTAGPISFAGNPPASGQFIFAYLDQPGSGGNPPITGFVIETDEAGNNWLGDVETFTTDLRPLVLSYDAITQDATLTYAIVAPAPVAPFEIRFFLDRNNNSILDGGDLPQVGNVPVLAGNPGAYVVIQSYAGNAPASHQHLFAVVDFNDAVVEDDELNNTGIGINSTPTDLVAVALAYDSVTQNATLSYAVQAPISVTAYNIEFVLDANNDGIPNVGDTIVAAVPGQTAPGAYALAQSFAGNTPASGQFVFAIIDRLPGPNGAVIETIEGVNNRVATSNTATTDLIAVSLAYDANTKDATLSYVVNSPIDVPAYFIDFLLDADGSGGISGGDPVVSVVNGSPAPGAYTQTASFVGNPPASGQKVFARVDLGNAVVETDEGNNIAEATNTAPTDLVANLFGSLTYDSNTQTATLNYEVISPAAVPAYQILFLLDGDGNLTPSFGDTLVGIQAGITTAGLHTTTQAFAGPNAPASGQAIFAILDLAGAVTEVNELNNIAATINTATTDLQAVSLAYDSNTRQATLNYVILSPTNVAGNAIQFYLETNGTAGLQIGGGGDTIVAVIPGDLTPGGHAATASYNLLPPATGQFLYATIDTADAVAETNELNNLATTFNTTPTDLVAISLAYDSNTDIATLSYAVNAPANVPAYVIRFFLDRDNSGTLNGADAPMVAQAVGQVAPGAYVATANFAGSVPATGQFIFAVIDPPLGTGGSVPESDEAGNNVASTTNTEGTDLVANVVQVFTDHVNGTTTAKVAYAIYSPHEVDPFSLKVGIDRDANGTIDGGGSDVLADIAIVNLADRLPGVHVVDVPDFQAALNGFAGGSRIQYGAQIVATLDLNQDGSPAGAVTETIEQLNNKVAAIPTVDLVANSVAILTDPSASSTRARVAYTIDSPGKVEQFKIRIGLDRNNDGVIDDPADVLRTETVTGADLEPGTHLYTTGNFRPALNAALPPLQDGDRLIATLDLLQNNTPENGVVEKTENTNNIARQVQRVDLVADALSIMADPLAGTTEASVAYTVNSPGSVAPFSLKVGVDRDHDGRIDDPDGLLADVALSGADVTPGAHTVLVPGLRAALNGLTTKIKNGDAILATLDLLLDGTDAAAVVEDIETDNNTIGQIQAVDLIAVSISVTADVLAGTTDASVAYAINAPADVAAFSLKIGVDRDGDGLIDDPDGLLSDTALAGAELTPGIHTKGITGLRAALNALATSLKDGDAIVATLDLLLDGTDQAAVAEASETDNNAIGQIQTVDLIANAISITSDDVAGTTVADVSYLINSPANVAAFDIHIGVDRDGDSIIDGPADMLATIAAPDLTPGTHALTSANLRTALQNLAVRLANGDRIIATLDLLPDGTPANAVGEIEEQTNNLTSQTQIVDLVATAVELFTVPASGEQRVRVNYTVNSPGAVTPFIIRVGVDTNGDSILDAGTLLTSFDLSVEAPGLSRPGSRQIAADITAALNAYPFANGDRLIATLDIADDGAGTPENLVGEAEETANNVTRQPLSVDLVAISLAYDSNSDWAELSYLVNSPGGVPAYDLEFWLDADKDGLFDAALDTLVATVPGAIVPGGFTALGDFTATQVDSQQFIFAVIDRADTVVEHIEFADPATNNLAATDNTEITDLVANAITVVSDDIANTTTATVAYTIVAPNPFTVPAFDILIGVDRDGDNLIDSAADVLATIAAPDLTPGFHEAATGNLRPALEALTARLNHGDRLIAMLDLTWDGLPVNAVEEIGGDEIGNNVSAYTVLVDLVATAVEAYTLPGTGEKLARISYTVDSPGAVAPFFIRVGVDTDGDRIIDPGTLLATIDLSTEPAGKLRPGDRNEVTADLTAGLNALAVPLQNADRIIATLDILDDGLGTPENLVVENEETDNNRVRTPMTVDLVAQTIFLTVDIAAGTTGAAVGYTVSSFGRSADFELRIGIDRDGDNVIDAGAGDLLHQVTIVSPDTEPGAHVYTVADIRAALNALSPPIKYGDRIIATLDLTPAGADEAAVQEINEIGNNVTSTAGTQDQIIDVIADELALNVGSFIATVNYTVISPANVAPFVIRIGRDIDADNLIDDPIIDLPGDVTPGAHSVQADIADALRLLGVAAGETVHIVADVDADNTVIEITEINNQVIGAADYLVDLVALGLRHPCATLDAPFDATFEYLVQFNQPGENFDIRLYASDDNDVTINPDDLPVQTQTITLDADKTVGGHTVVFNGLLVSSADFPTGFFYVKARIDDALALNETSETNNVFTRPNAALDPSEDSDGDGVPDCFDECPADPNKTSPGACGCGVPDTDTDGDGTPNCFDLCPADPGKIAPGTCGCGVPDTDTDGDGTPDCVDNCPTDPAKLDPGVCGCGAVDDLTDADLDGTPDCIDPDPNDPDVPNPNPNPNPQPVPNQNPIDIFLPLLPPFPMPVCGIGLCGSGSLLPVGLAIVGFIGLRRQVRRRR